MASELRDILHREALAGNNVLLRNHDDHVWLAQYAPVFSRWTCVSPTRGSISLTMEQLLDFGFSDVMLVRPDGLKGTQ